MIYAVISALMYVTRCYACGQYMLGCGSQIAMICALIYTLMYDVRFCVCCNTCCAVCRRYCSVLCNVSSDVLYVNGSKCRDSHKLEVALNCPSFSLTFNSVSLDSTAAEMDVISSRGSRGRDLLHP